MRTKFKNDALHRLTYASGAYGTFSYAYDAIGNMTEKAGVTMAYGENGVGPHAVTSTADGLTMTYDANGNMLEKRPGNDFLTQFFQFDAENRLVEVATAQTETVVLTFQPGWNFFSLPVIPDNGAVVVLLPSFAQEFEQIAKFDPVTGTFEHYVGNPEFDDFSALEYGVGYQVYCTATSPVTVSITGKLPAKTLSKSLAAGWHLLGATDDDASLSVATWLAGVDSSQVQAYDTDTGSLTSATDVVPGQAYYVKVATDSSWTPPLPQDVSTSFVYDGDGGKVKEITPSGTTTRLGEVFEQAPGGETTKYLFAGSLRIAAKDSTGNLRFYHGDHLGSSNVVTDGTGTLVELTEHTPFGSVSRNEGTVDVAHKFTGQRQDTTHGLVLFPARAYDPSLGRFLQPDPFVQNPADPQTLNRYTYVRNSPINLVDPSGNFFGFIIAAIFSVITAAATVEAGFLITAIVGAAAAAAGFALGNAIDNASASRNQAPSSAAPSPPAPQMSTASPPSPAFGAGLGAFPGTSFAPLAKADIVASETLEDSWGPDDAIFVLIGLGVAAKAAAVAARELGPAVLGGLRSLGETGAIRLGAGKGIEELAETHITRSGRTVLGRFPEYIQKARTRGASYFDIGKAWNRLTDAERWRANKHFLDMIVSYRDRALLSLPKGDIRKGSWLAREVEYLIKKKGYRWLNQWALGPK